MREPTKPGPQPENQIADTDAEQVERARRGLSLTDLAKEVLRVLDLQQRYFKSKDHLSLVASKEAEQNLRQTCQKVLKTAEPNLFDPPPFA